MLDEIEESPGIVLLTLLEKDLVSRLESKCKDINVPSLSIMGPVMQLFEAYAIGNLVAVDLDQASNPRIRSSRQRIARKRCRCCHRGSWYGRAGDGFQERGWSGKWAA